MPGHSHSGRAAAAGHRGGAPVRQTTPIPAAGAVVKPAARLTPAAAATRIQTEWRRARLSRHRPALKELAAAAGQLRKVRAQFKAVQAGQAGMPLTQKQYLELSETVMKVLFALDAISCGAPELRAKRKELTTGANKLLDEIQAAHKAAPSAAAGRSSGSAAASGAAKQQQQPAQQQKEKKSGGAKWFRR